MDILNNLVRNLVILVIVMTFLEMLLPDNKLKSTAKLIFGLMIIATLLNPIVVLLNDLGRASFDLSEYTFVDDMSYFDEEDVQDFYNQMTLNQYIENIEGTVVELIDPHIEGLKPEVAVVIDEDFASKDFGKLVQINIYLYREHEGVKPIKPVVIGEKIVGDDFVEYEKGQEIKTTIKNHFQISESIIEVYIEREEG